MNYTDMKKLCKTYNVGFDEVEEHIMDWGRENKGLQKDIREIMALDHSPRFPSGYGGMSTGNYLLSLILTDPKAIRKLSVMHDAALGAKAKQVLSYWKEHPAFWCYFTIKKRLEDDFLTIVDLLTGFEHLLYSPGICDMQKKENTRDKHYLCLMLGNEECLQTVGILRFNALRVSDFLFYCDLFDSRASLDSVINKHYTKFFLLDEISTIPVVMHREALVLYTWQEFTLETFDISLLGGEWIIKETADMISYFLENPDTSMMDVPHGDLLESDFPSMSFTLYRDTKTGAMAINSTALASYSIIAALLQRSYPALVLPKKPEVAISMVLFTILDRLGLDLPWSKFKTIMDFKEESKEPESDDMTQAKELINQCMVAQNTGKPLDAAAYSKKTGMDLETVESLMEQVQKMFAKNIHTYEVPAEDTKYELSGWPVPPPSSRKPFSNSLVDSDIFIFDEGPNTLTAFDALTGGLYREEIFEDGLPEFIEDLFDEVFNDYRFCCMLENTFFWILFHKGKEWLPVRSYAIEILKLFPNPIQEAYPSAEAFIAIFSIFTKKILCTRGICSLSARPKAAEVKNGTYAIKGSDAFYSLVEGVKAL